MAGCRRCGSRTPNRLCRDCQLADRHDTTSAPEPTTGARPVECTDCGQLYRHDGSDGCPVCGERTRRYIGPLNEADKWEEDGDLPHVCEICETTFETVDRLIGHDCTQFRTYRLAADGGLVCPSCGESIDPMHCWRCKECGRDLTDVDAGAQPDGGTSWGVVDDD